MRVQLGYLLLSECLRTYHYVQIQVERNQSRTTHIVGVLPLLLLIESSLLILNVCLKLGLMLLFNLYITN